MWGCGKYNNNGDVVAQLGMWWLSGDVVAQWDVVAQLGMWWLSGDVVAQWGCGDSIGDVVAPLAKARLGEPDCNAAVPGSIPASSTVS
jgi:hypothetical protein